jgi:hypothetical protein
MAAGTFDSGGVGRLFAVFRSGGLHPEPRMWILGNLHDGAVVDDLLRACGVDAKDVKR